MVTNGVRRIVLLKDMPSNIVEEAIVVLKPNKYAEKRSKNVECFEYKNKFTKNEKEGDFIIKEAENVVLEYVKTIEKSKNQAKVSNTDKKYRKMCYITAIVSFLYVIELLLKFVNN